MPLSFPKDIPVFAEDDAEYRLYLCRVHKGKGGVCRGKVACNVQAGDLLLVGGWERCSITAEEGLLIHVTAFDRRLFSSCHAYAVGREAFSSLLAFTRGSEVLTPRNASYRDALATVDSLWREAEAGTTGSMLMAVSLLWQFSALLRRETESRESGFSSVRDRHNRDRVTPAVEYISRHYDKKITLADLARAVNMSVPNFSAVFREAVGIPPMEYLTRLRLQYAVELLQNTDKKIIDIAEECGFFSISNFIKAFHNGMDMTPSQYRRQTGGPAQKQA